MKTALYGVILSALLAAGCVTKPSLWPDDSPGPAEQQAAQPRKHGSVVRADQVNQENAHEKAHDLEEELENDNEAPN